MTTEELVTLETLLMKAKNEGKLNIYDHDNKLVFFEYAWSKNGGLIIEIDTEVD